MAYKHLRLTKQKTSHYPVTMNTKRTRPARVKRGCFDFGDKIKSLLRVFRMTQAQLQEETGIRITKLSKWKGNLQQRPNVYADEAVVIAEYFARRLDRDPAAVLWYLLNDQKPADLESASPQQLWDDQEEHETPESPKHVATQKKTSSGENSPNKSKSKRHK